MVNPLLRYGIVDKERRKWVAVFLTIVGGLILFGAFAGYIYTYKKNKNKVWFFLFAIIIFMFFMILPEQSFGGTYSTLISNISLIVMIIYFSLNFIGCIDIWLKPRDFFEKW